MIPFSHLTKAGAFARLSATAVFFSLCVSKNLFIYFTGAFNISLSSMEERRMKSGNMMKEAACEITKILNRTRCDIWVNWMEHQCL